MSTWKLIYKLRPVSLCMGLALILLSACQPEPQASQEPSLDGKPVSESKIQTVEVVQPQPRSFTASTVITGTSAPNQKVMVHAMEGGFVRRINKDLGDQVRKGEVIALLSNPELPREAARLDTLMRVKRSIYQRLASIQSKTPALTTLQQVDEAKADYLMVKSSLDAIRDRIGFLTVRAPFSGIITQRFVDHGAMVQSAISNKGAVALVEIQETDPIRLILPLPESDIASVRKGMEVEIEFPELSGESFKAPISRTANALDPKSGTMQVQIDIPNPKGVIRPGMYAKVYLELESREGVLSLPTNAQTMYEDTYFLLEVKNGIVHKVPLKKGLSNKSYFEVLNANISKESKLIVQGKSLVKAGQKVDAKLNSK